jgi:hypothetical protein
MSDFSGLEQTFALPGLSSAVFDGLPPYEPPSMEVQPHEINFMRLHGTREIARILHLRNEISLPSSVQADAGFAVREKKETSWAWSVHSCVLARRSAPSA